MKMEKKKYLIPRTEAFSCGSELMEVIGTSPTPVEDQPAKSADDVIDDEADLAAPIKDKWDDLSEKKNGK